MYVINIIAIIYKLIGTGQLYALHYTLITSDQRIDALKNKVTVHLRFWIFFSFQKELIQYHISIRILQKKWAKRSAWDSQTRWAPYNSKKSFFTIYDWETAHMFIELESYLKKKNTNEMLPERFIVALK